ncbi:MAG TPA: hypothetical protein VEN95_06935 [Actinomycetota bacterium]|nr:hypothetical protein [Actinomycetota bacterium]
MCRALKVLCVASDRQTLTEMKRAAVSAEWELAPGAITEVDALAQLDAEQPHVLVVFGEFESLVSRAREGRPSLRIVCDRELPGATAVVGRPGEIRDAVRALPRPGGPVR